MQFYMQLQMQFYMHFLIAQYDIFSKSIYHPIESLIS